MDSIELTEDSSNATISTGAREARRQKVMVICCDDVQAVLTPKQVWNALKGIGRVLPGKQSFLTGIYTTICFEFSTGGFTLLMHRNACL